MKPSDTLLWLASLANAQNYNNFKTKPSDLINTQCRDSDKLPTLTYGSKDIVFTICTEKYIKGTVLEVHNAIVDFASYPKWNTFVIDVEARSGSSLTPSPPPVGTKMTFTTTGLIPKVNTKSLEEISYVNPDVDGHSATRGTYAMSAWKGDMTKLAPLEHVNVVMNVGYGYTRYVSYESYYPGVTAAAIALKGKLQKQFDQQGEDLKKYVEGGSK
ncbi:unnamed protein product [Zymoseptoria tritici ST99CH_1E4]|uniref:Uncharacterized protein n=2 Tax=Zymoseptoria tritici TaxID=1047171 RepID=F9X2X8_ZYMTI|nr:uncharacterized protein MYCGRDRAFT_90751 [Zymoseptoria tritici IPO323]EGP90524.1 hypothetical protein MYCGRDRAFT_90751 [Zymoseptoria tritici IPO323]SMR46164.1 unnamed protein product [Zymoseptoria tritici ST99CH_1E4]